MLKPELTIYDYTRILKKRKWIILIAVAFVMLFTLIFTVLQENVYRTKSTVMLGKSNLLSDIVTDYYVASDNIHTEAKVIRSTAVLEKVVRMIEERRAGTNAVVLEQADLDRRVTRLAGRVSTAIDQNTKTIDILVTGSDPAEVKETADIVAAAYVKVCEERRYRDLSQANSFLMDQLEVYRKKLDEEEGKLQEFKEGAGIVDIGLELRAKLEITNGLSNSLAQALVQKKTLEERLRRMRESQRGGDIATMPAQDERQDLHLLEIKRKLTDLEVQRIKALELYTPAHPEVRRLDAAIRGHHAQLRAKVDERKDNEELSLELQVAIEETKINALSSTLEEANGEVAGLPRKQAQLARLEQRVEFTRNLVAMFNKKLEDSNIFKAERTGDLPTVLERAATPSGAIRPRPLVNLVIGLVTGFMIGIFFAFFIESIDVSISTVEEVENYVSLPVLGIIPFISEDGAAEPAPRAAPDANVGERCVIYHRPRSIGAEAFRIVRTNLHFAMMGEKRTILVASSLPGEGKTFVAVNLAITFAQLGSKVLLCDFNLRDPEMHSYFGFSKNPGVTDILIGDMDWREAVKPTAINNLHLLCSGPIPPNPSELLISSQCDALIANLKSEYDLIIFDSSPLIPVTDGSILSTKLDFTVLVHNAIQTSMMVLLRAKSLLQSVKGQVGGVLLNQLKSTIFMDTDVPMNYYYASKEKNRRRTRETVR